jgi:hypothetical protein
MNKNVSMFFDFVNKIGIPLNQDMPPLLIFSYSVLSLAIICLISFITIMVYIIVIYITKHEILLSKLSNWPRLLKFINFYGNIRFVYLGIEVALFLWSLTAIMRLCWRVIQVLS